MPYYLVKNTAQKKPGVPVHLDALLHETFDAKGASIPMGYDWVCRADTIPGRGTPFSFPDELWLVSKDPSIRFDCHLAFGGMLASDRFLKLLGPEEIDNFKISKVNATNRKRENIASHPLFYVKFKPVVRAVDRRNTVFVQMNLGGKLIVTPSQEPAIGLVKTLSLNAETIRGMNLFVSHDLSVNDTFVSQRFKEGYENEGMAGLDFVDIDDYFKAETFKIRDLEASYGRPLAEIPTVSE